MANPFSASYSFTIMDLQVRVPLPGLYIDDIREAAAGDTVRVINTIPEDGETGVPKDDLIRLHIVSLDTNPLSTDVKVYITRSSTGVKQLAYDQADGGFKPGFDGADSSATLQGSPGSAISDELILVIDHTVEWSSQELITVEVEGGGLA